MIRGSRQRLSRGLGQDLKNRMEGLTGETTDVNYLSLCVWSTEAWSDS